MFARPQMKTFSSDGVTLAYLDQPAARPDAEPVLLIHGFASNAATNWVNTGWVSTLSSAGYRVVAFDNRGHGASEKLYRIEDYGAPLMAEDARRLLDHLGIGRAHVIGYSMGARIAAFLAIRYPDRVRSVVFGGLAANMIRGVGGAEPIAQALEADSIDSVQDPMPRSFRAFAEATGSDLRALAACMRSSRQKITEEELGRIGVPVLVVVGGSDDIAGSPEPLVAAIPGARALVIPGRDHMKTVGDKTFKKGVLEFLAERP